MEARTDPESLARRVVAGDRQALARAITLIESHAPEDAVAGESLLRALLPHTGRSVRIGITGAPGVGKSTLIDQLGSGLCSKGKSVAVLPIDPSSSRSKGSILGDKTRMSRLLAFDSAFVRPSPGGGTLGGTAARTREALLLCEAAGFDVVIVETIGTGQSETAVRDLVDFYLLLLSPAAGDELQGIKRGVMELVDGVVVNKADGALTEAAERAAQQCRLALHVLRPDERELLVTTASALEDRGIDTLWQEVDATVSRWRADGSLDQRRIAQAATWLDSIVHEQLLAEFAADPRVQQEIDKLRQAVTSGAELPGAAARRLLALHRQGR
jgi:LAO/AO transport system kinase